MGVLRCVGVIGEKGNWKLYLDVSEDILFRYTAISADGKLAQGTDSVESLAMEKILNCCKERDNEKIES